jgi:hypothetical protein
MYSTWLEQFIIGLNRLLGIKLNIQNKRILINQILTNNFLFKNQLFLANTIFPFTFLEKLILNSKLISKLFLIFLLIHTIFAILAVILRMAQIYDILLIVILVFYGYFDLYFVLVLGFMKVRFLVVLMRKEGRLREGIVVLKGRLLRLSSLGMRVIYVRVGVGI